MWKGAFAPLVKHHGGNIYDHVSLDLPDDFDLSPGRTWKLKKDRWLHVNFKIEHYGEDGEPGDRDPIYKVKMQLTEKEAEHLNDSKVRRLIAAELKKPSAERRWIPAGDEPEMDDMAPDSSGEVDEEEFS